MRIRISKQTRIILAGVLVGSLIGALGALFYHRQQRSRLLVSEAAASTRQQALPLGRLVSLFLSMGRLVRDIIDLAGGE